MSTSEFKAIPVRPCKKCGAADRNKNNECKACNRAKSYAWKDANPEKAKAASAAYRARNLEKVRAATAAWRLANPEHMKAYSAAYIIANPEKAKAAVAAYRAAYSKQIHATSAAWRAANPDACRLIAQNRRARKKNAPGQLSKGLSKKLFILQQGKCPCCKKPLGKNYHLDHKMPLFLGGSNHDDNMQLLRSTCNQNKHAKHPVDFMQERGFLL